MSISARRLSSTACWTCASVIETPLSAALALTLLADLAAAGSGPHWPSSAAVSSSVGAGGQSARAQLGPSAARGASRRRLAEAVEVGAPARRRRWPGPRRSAPAARRCSRRSAPAGTTSAWKPALGDWSVIGVTSGGVSRARARPASGGRDSRSDRTIQAAARRTAAMDGAIVVVGERARAGGRRCRLACGPAAPARAPGATASGHAPQVLGRAARSGSPRSAAKAPSMCTRSWSPLERRVGGHRGEVGAGLRRSPPPRAGRAAPAPSGSATPRRRTGRAPRSPGA